MSRSVQPLVVQPLPTAGPSPAVRTEPLAFHVMTKPIGPICNLDCRYCFYLEKEDLYEQEGRKERPSWEMPPDILETYIRQYIEQQDVPEVSFAWQGGEPTLLGVRFFERVVVMVEGKIVADAPAADLIADPRLDAAFGVRFERIRTAAGWSLQASTRTAA